MQELTSNRTELLSLDCISLEEIYSFRVRLIKFNIFYAMFTVTVLGCLILNLLNLSVNL